MGENNGMASRIGGKQLIVYEVRFASPSSRMNGFGTDIFLIVLVIAACCRSINRNTMIEFTTSVLHRVT